MYNTAANKINDDDMIHGVTNNRSMTAPFATCVDFVASGARKRRATPHDDDDAAPLGLWGPKLQSVETTFEVGSIPTDPNDFNYITNSMNSLKDAKLPTGGCVGTPCIIITGAETIRTPANPTVVQHKGPFDDTLPLLGLIIGCVIAFGALIAVVVSWGGRDNVNNNASADYADTEATFSLLNF